MICLLFFFFNDAATTEISTLSLHDALPIYIARGAGCEGAAAQPAGRGVEDPHPLAVGGIGDSEAEPIGVVDRKSTRLNSSHANISYAVFCLKKKNHTHSIEIEDLEAASQTD